MTEMDAREYAETLAAARAGDEPAFTALFRSTQPSVLRYLGGIAPGRAEDLAAETWLHVVRGLDTFRSPDLAGFRAWVLTIARHRWVDDQRARGRRPEHLVADLPDRPGGADAADAVVDVMATETAIALIGELPRDQAEAELLRVVADLDVTAVARIMDRSPGAVRVLTHRGLRRLCTRLSDPAATSAKVTPQHHRALRK
jgi:RNA polymerase sigma-70 factor (ECF subfamily)